MAGTPLEAKRRFDELRSEIEAIETGNPDLAVQVFEKPSAVAVSSGHPRGLRRSVLRKLVLRAVSGEIWVEKGEGSWPGTEPWSDNSMRPGVEGLPRDGRPLVEFVEVDL